MVSSLKTFDARNRMTQMLTTHSMTKCPGIFRVYTVPGNLHDIVYIISGIGRRGQWLSNSRAYSPYVLLRHTKSRDFYVYKSCYVDDTD